MRLGHSAAAHGLSSLILVRRPGDGRNALETICQESARAQIVRRARELITSPCTKTMSPRSTLALPRVERFLSDAVEADHHLQVGTVTLLQVGVAKHKFPELRANITRPATPTIWPVSVLAASRIGLPDLGQRVGAGHLDRIGLTALGQQPLPAWPDGSGTARERRTRNRADQVRSRRSQLK